MHGVYVLYDVDIDATLNFDQHIDGIFAKSYYLYIDLLFRDFVHRNLHVLKQACPLP